MKLFVKNHAKQAEKSMVVIMSAYESQNPAHRNETQHDALCLALEEAGIPFREAEGMYKGEIEQSVVIALPDDEHDTRWEEVRRLAFDVYNQESILLSVVEYIRITGHADRTAYLMDSGGDAEPIGNLRSIPGPSGRDAWTNVDGRYYACV